MTKDEEVEQIQRDFAALADKVGIENVPLHDEKLRPLLLLMQRVGEKNGRGVAVFGLGDTEKLRFGLFSTADTAQYMGEAVVEEMCEDEAMRAFDGEHHLQVLVQGDRAVLYHNDLWMPIGALASRQN